MGHMACTEPQCLYKGALYLTLPYNCNYVISTQTVVGRIRLMKVACKFCYAASVPTFLSEMLANTLNFCGYVMRVLITQRFLSSRPLSQPFKAYWLLDARTSLTFNNCTLCPYCIYVFCIYLRTNSDLCHLHHKLTDFYNRDGKCLLHGTDWVFK